MSKKDFFRIIFKLFGLYSVIITVLNYIPANISYVFYKFEPLIILWVLGATILAIGLYILLIRKTDKILSWLKIEEGFDDDRIEIGNFNGLGVLKLALILIGGFLVVDHLPKLLHYTYLAFKKEVSPNGLNLLESYDSFGQMDYAQWAISGINVVMGYLLLMNYKRMASWLNKKNNVG